MQINTNIAVDVQADITAINRISIIPSILKVICKTTGMRFAAIARVTDKQWIACSVKDDINFGLMPGGELPLESTICNEIRQHLQPVVFDDISEDEVYACHKASALYKFRGYISVPILRKDGSFFGTLCAIDPKPANLKNSETVEMFKLYADLIAFHLNTVDQLRASEAQLKYEQQTAILREQFIAILGHDLRNPIGAIVGSAQVLQRVGLDKKALKFVDIIQNASRRMQDLIDNMLDFARGHLGEGIQLDWQEEPAMTRVLSQVSEELSVLWRERIIKTDFAVNRPICCDSKRIAQLLSNLIANALTHGAADKPIYVTASCTGEGLTLSVANSGDPIPAATMERLFEPFARSEINPTDQGLGLGLYICSEIARAHGASLSVSSTSEETRFTFFLPSNYSLQ